MPTYFYKARSQTGAPLTGSVQAENLLAARRLLMEQQMIPLSVSENAMGGLEMQIKELWLRISNPISLEDILIFNQQMQTAYSVGLSLLDALNLIHKQTHNPRLKSVITSIIADVTEGKALNEALQRHPAIFDNIYVNAIKAGESSGKLDEILTMLAAFTEQQIENQAKIKAATFYPKIVFGAIGIVILTVIYFVIPRIKEFYGKFGGELPLITRIVMGGSEFMINYWFIPAAIVGLGIYLWKRYVSTPKGRMAWARLQLKLPIFGEILQQQDVFLFSAVMELLIRAGISIIESFQVVRNSMSNEAMRLEIDKFIVHVQEGKSITDAFQNSTLFPPMVGNLISVGEESGKLDVVLKKIAHHYKGQLDYKLNNLSKAVEPLLLGVIFVVVLVLTLSIFLPIWKMSRLLKPK